jgi:hypothetical protein
MFYFQQTSLLLFVEGWRYKMLAAAIRPRITSDKDDLDSWRLMSTKKDTNPRTFSQIYNLQQTDRCW